MNGKAESSSVGMEEGEGERLQAGGMRGQERQKEVSARETAPTAESIRYRKRNS